MTKRMIFVVIILVVILGGTLGFDGYKAHMMKMFAANFKFPPQVVSTVTVQSQTWRPTIEAVGSLKAIQGVDINPELPGQVVGIFFKSGDVVKKGQSLIQLDDSFNQAQLRNNLAALKLAKLDFARQKTLFKTGATSKQALDQASAQLGQTEAQVAADKVNIEKKDIKAPFDGVIGIRHVNIGQYVSAGQALVGLQQMDPLFIDFTLPEQDLKKIYKDQPVVATIDAFPDLKFTGSVMAIDSTVDINTRTFMVRAMFPNKDDKLYPGVFANVHVILPEQKNVITIPQTAISYTLYGDSVYVVSPKGNEKTKTGQPLMYAKLTTVTLGQRRGDQVAVLSGLKAGQQIINAGQVKLQGSSEVVVNNSIKLKESSSDVDG